MPASLRPRPKSPFYQDTSPCPGPTLIISAEAGTHSWQGLGAAHVFVGEHSSCCSQQTVLACSDSKMLGTRFLTPKHSHSGSGEAHTRAPKLAFAQTHTSVPTHMHSSMMHTACCAHDRLRRRGHTHTYG